VNNIYGFFKAVSDHTPACGEGTWGTYTTSQLVYESAHFASTEPATS
jgi:hypothetical protein